MQSRTPLFTFAALILATGACVVGEPDGDSKAGDGLSDEDINGTAEDGNGTLSARVCADSGTTKGIDVSYYQGTIDWNRVKGDGVEFAFIRVSDGVTFKDPKFARNWTASRDAGVIRGAYQFFRPAQDPIAQADLFVNAVGTLAANDLPPVVDVEATGNLSPAQIQAKLRIWVDRVTARLGRAPIVYTGKYFWRDEVGAPSTYANHALWIAQYTSQCPDLPSPWARWTFWQHTDSGRVAGISGNVDMNKFNGDLAALQAFASGQQAVAAPAIRFDWERWTDGSYTFFADAPAAVTKVEIRIEGYLIGSVTRGGDGLFTLDYTFNYARAAREIEVRGLSATGGLAALGTGMIDSTTGETTVFIRQVGDHTYELGVDDSPSSLSAIELAADGVGVYDDLSGTAHSTRLAVLHAFTETGPRTFSITTFDLAGNPADQRTRTFTVR